MKKRPDRGLPESRRTVETMRKKRHRLAVECAKLDPEIEVQMAEEGLADDVSGWPEY